MNRSWDLNREGRKRKGEREEKLSTLMGFRRKWAFGRKRKEAKTYGRLDTRRPAFFCVFTNEFISDRTNRCKPTALTAAGDLSFGLVSAQEAH